MTGNITFKGTPLALAGRSVQIGRRAPEFRVISRDLKEVRLSDSKGMTRVITSFPSLDTPVCDLQVKEFNKRASTLAKGVAVLGISMDLPFAQKRFCDQYDIEHVTVLSDYRYASFGVNYGLLIRDLRLLARGVLVVDNKDLVRYMQVVPELTESPDYDGALRALDEALKKPLQPEEEPLAQCLPCEGKIKALADRDVLAMSARIPRWEVIEARRLVREFAFKDFQEAKSFAGCVATIADEQGHHPVVVLGYNKVKISLTTHAAGGLTRNDFVMAAIIDGIH